MPKTETAPRGSCMGCGEDRELPSERLCNECYKAAEKIMIGNDAYHERYQAMTRTQRWERAKEML